MKLRKLRNREIALLYYSHFALNERSQTPFFTKLFTSAAVFLLNQNEKPLRAKSMQQKKQIN